MESHITRTEALVILRNQIMPTQECIKHKWVTSGQPKYTRKLI